MKQDSAIRKTIAIFLLAGLLLGVVGCMNPPVQTDITSPEDSTRLPETTDSTRLPEESTRPPETTKASESEKPSIYRTKSYSLQPITLDSGAFACLQNFFAEVTNLTYRWDCFVVEDYENLCEVYAFAKTRPQHYYSFYFSGNAVEAEQANAYPLEYFNDGYLLVLLHDGGYGNAKIECEARKNGDLVEVIAHDYEPWQKAIWHGAGIYLVPLEGTYVGESFELTYIHYSAVKPSK